MGLFWDLIQQSQISQQHSRATSLEDRLERVEIDLVRTRALVHELVCRLENHLGEDIDGDGHVSR